MYNNAICALLCSAPKKPKENRTRRQIVVSHFEQSISPFFYKIAGTTFSGGSRVLRGIWNLSMHSPGRPVLVLFFHLRCHPVPIAWSRFLYPRGKESWDTEKIPIAIKSKCFINDSVGCDLPSHIFAMRQHPTPECSREQILMRRRRGIVVPVLS